MNPRPLRVLVVDDERDTVLTLGILFRSEGVQVEMLRNGQDVATKVAGFRPDVVLLDIGMPGRDGLEVAQELRARFGNARPVLVAITGRAGAEDRRKAQAAGFDHYFPKPYDPQELLGCVTSFAQHAMRVTG